MMRSTERWAGGPRVWHHVPGPKSIGPLDPHIFLRGAALALTGIDSVWISVDDSPPHQARVGIPNQLVKETFPDEHGPGSGDWMIAVDAGSLDPGSHEITALAISRAGSAAVASRELEVDLDDAYQQWLRHRRPARLLASGHSPARSVGVLLLTEVDARRVAIASRMGRMGCARCWSRATRVGRSAWSGQGPTSRRTPRSGRSSAAIDSSARESLQISPRHSPRCARAASPMSHSSGMAISCNQMRSGCSRATATLTSPTATRTSLREDGTRRSPDLQTELVA